MPHSSQFFEERKPNKYHVGAGCPRFGDRFLQLNWPRNDLADPHCVSLSIPGPTGKGTSFSRAEKSLNLMQAPVRRNYAKNKQQYGAPKLL